VTSQFSADLAPIFEAIADRAARLCESQDVRVFVVEGGFLRYVAGFGDIQYPLDPLRPLTRGLATGRAVIDRAVVHIDDFATVPESEFPEGRANQRRFGYHTTLAVPLVLGDKALGAILLRRREVRPFDSKHIELVKAFAEQAAVAIENLRLSTELKARNAELTEALEQQTATADILKVISSSPTDIQPVLDAVAESAARLCDANDVIIRRVDGDVLRLVAHLGSIPVVADAVTITRGTVPGCAVVERRTIHIPDVLEAHTRGEYPEGASFQRGAGDRTFLAVPLLREDVAVGVIVIRRLEVRPFSDKQIKLLETFAAQAVIAIENVRLFNETNEALEQQTATADILKVISSSPTDVMPVLDAVTHRAAQLCDAPDARLFLVDGDAVNYITGFGQSKGAIPRRPLHRSFVVGRAILDQSVVHIEDIVTAFDEFPDAREPQREFGNRTMLAVPLVRDGKAFGAILMRRKIVRPFTDKQIALLKTFADQAVIAIENVRLFNETKEALEQQTATADILKVISGSPTDIQPVLDAVAESAARLCEAKDVIIRRVDGDLLHVAAHFGSVPVLREALPIIRGVPGGRAVLERRTIHIRDLADEQAQAEYPESGSVQRGVPYRTILAVPLLREDMAIGVIAIRRPEARPFSDQQIKLLEIFAAQAAIAIENVRLFNETKEALEQQTATADILKVISSSPTDIQPVLDAVAESAARLCEARDVIIRRVEGDVAHAVAHIGPVPVPGNLPIASRNITGCVIRERRTVHIRDVLDPEVREEYPEALFLQRCGSMLAAPLMCEGRVIGSITIRREEIRSFSDKQIKLLETFAAQAAIAIENVRLFNETKEALEQQTVISEILRVISSSPTDTQPVFDAIVRSGLRLFGGSNVSLRLVKGDYTEIVAGTLPGLDTRGAFRIQLDDESVPSVRSVRRREFVHVPDILAAEWISEHARDRAKDLGFRAIMCAPMLRESHAVGSINVFRAAPGSFTEKQVALLKTFANQAVIAIENVRLFKELQSRNVEVTEALEQQTATAEILKVISQSPTDTQPVFQAILANATRLCEASVSALFLFDGEVLVNVAHQNASPAFAEFLKRSRPRPSRETVTRRAALERRTVHVADFLNDPEYSPPEFQRKENARSVLAVPLLREGALIGVVTMWRREVRPFTEKQIALVQTFADQAVIAIENVRLFKELQARNAELLEALEQQTATAEILRVISSSPTDIQPVLEAVAQNAGRLCGANDVVIRLLEGDVHHGVAHYGLIPMVGPLTLHGSIAGRAMVDRKTVQIEDLLEPTVRAEFREADATVGGYRTFLAAPLLREDTAVGAIVMRREEVSPFTDKQIALLETFADQAVIAIENVRLFKELQARNAEVTEALEQQTATAEILRVISSSPTNVQPVLDAVAEYATRVCDAGDAGVNLIDGTAFRLVAHYGTIPAVTRDESIPLNRGTVVGRAILERRPVHVPDLFAAEDFPEGRILGARFGNRTTLAVPLLREGTPIGALLIRRTDVRPFSDKQIKLLETFADQAVIAIENVRLFNETKEALEQQTVTAEILKVISSSPTDVQPVFEAIVKSGVHLFDGLNVVLRLVNGDHIEQVASTLPRNVDDDVPFEISDSFPSTRAILHREVNQVPDVFAEEGIHERLRRRANQLGYRAVMAAPMLRENRAIGAITVVRATPGLFNDKQIALLKTFADQAVIAIENVRLFKELQERNAEVTESLEQQTATAEILKVISSSPTDVQPVFDAIVKSAVRLCGSSYASLRLINGSQTELVASVPAINVGGEDLDASLSSDRMPSTRAILRREVIQVPDVFSEEWVDARIKRRAKQIGYHAVISAPMLRDNVPIGAINVTRPSAGPFTDKQVALLKTFADQAVIAIENVRLFKELQARNTEVTEALDQQTAMAEILKVISSSPTDLQPVFDAILEKATRLCDAHFGMLGLYDGVKYQHVAHRGGSPEFLAFVYRPAFDLDTAPTIKRMVTERQAIHVPDLGETPGYRNKVPAALSSYELGGARSILAVPMLKEGRVVGGIFIYRPEVKPFTQKQIDLVSAFCSQAVIAIENVRLFKEIQEKGRQLEAANKHKSEFLANMSHELRTPLNAVIGFSDLLLEKMFGEMNAKQENYVRNIQSSGKHLLSLINDILDLSKIEAGRMELDVSTVHIPSALQNAMMLIRERAQRQNVELSCNIDSKVAEIPADERKFKQIVLNLLTNAVKFTPEGGRVDVDVRLGNGNLEVSVKDTGVGIAAQNQQAVFEEFRQVGRQYSGKQEGTGLGLALTRRFVELHGGTIRLQSALGKGSTFTFTIPVRQ
jgi:GAF domain-containing protein